LEFFFFVVVEFTWNRIFFLKENYCLQFQVAKVVNQVVHCPRRMDRALRTRTGSNEVTLTTEQYRKR